MKILLLFVVSLCAVPADGEAPSKASASLKARNNIGQSPNKSAPARAKETALPRTASQAIKKVFEDFVEILEKESLPAKEYKKLVRFLENSLYGSASFESLRLLAKVYEEKKDFKNQVNVLNVLSVNYPDNPESFYLLGLAHKKLYLAEGGLKSRNTKKLIEAKAENKQKAIENINKALKINKKYAEAYEALLGLLMEENPQTGEEIHTKESLARVIDMLKALKNNKHYILLCRAYYDNKFLKQTRRACAKSVKYNPKDPVSHLILALSHENKKTINVESLKTAKKFKNSFFVQYKTALHFMDQNPQVAGAYFNSAYSLQPKHIKLNQIMAHFFFNSKKEEKSYTHFLSACRLTKGGFLKEFKKALSSLRRKKMTELAFKFHKGVKQCLSERKGKSHF